MENGKGFKIEVNVNEKELMKELSKKLMEEVRKEIIEANTFKYVNKKQLADMFSVSINTVVKYQKEGMPYFKMDNVIRYEVSEVKKWANERSIQEGENGSK